MYVDDVLCTNINKISVCLSVCLSVILRDLLSKCNERHTNLPTNVYIILSAATLSLLSNLMVHFSLHLPRKRHVQHAHR